MNVLMCGETIPIVGQLTHIILHFVVQAPNLARMLLSMYLFKKAR